MPNNPQTLLVTNICSAIATTLQTATGIKTVRSIRNIKEHISGTDCPCLQVYPDRYIPNTEGETERFTYSGGIRKSKLIIFVDHYPRILSHIGLDLQVMVEGLDAIIEVLETQNSKPFFGIEGLQAFKWEWRQAILRYSEDSRFRGGRFTLTFIIF